MPHSGDRYDRLRTKLPLWQLLGRENRAAEMLVSRLARLYIPWALLETRSPIEYVPTAIWGPEGGLMRGGGDLVQG